MTNRVFVLQLLLALAASPVLAQGTFLYTWHGSLGLFQGSFQVTAEENQPGAYFYSQTFLNSIQFSSPDSTFAYSWPNSIAEGQAGSAGLSHLSLDLYDSTGQKELISAVYSGWATVREFGPSGPELWVEDGHWTFSQVPEPGVFSILMLGLSTLAFPKVRNRSA
jgi:hypothetical protein